MGSSATNLYSPLLEISLTRGPGRSKEKFYVQLDP